MTTPAPRLLLLLLPFLIAGACASQAVFPGDTVVGTFDFSAQADWQRTDCDPRSPELARASDGGFTFQGTFSRDSVDGGAWFTIDGYSRTASYASEAQRYTSYHRAAARLPSCGEGCEGAEVEETMSVVVLSDSQDRHLGSKCSNLGDGGVPSGSGLTPPGPTINGYDAQRACGELKVRFLPGRDCACKTACTATYSVEGKRRFE